MSAGWSRAGIAALASAAFVLGGCGGVSAADLFVVTRNGPAGAKLTMLVDEEGNVRCNGRPAGKLDDPMIVQARAIQEELHDPASAHLALPARPGSVISYQVRTEAGTVRFSDNSADQPHVFAQLALFVLQTAQQLCHVA
jgi:hypothetical protein